MRQSCCARCSRSGWRPGPEPDRDGATDSGAGRGRQHRRADGVRGAGPDRGWSLPARRADADPWLKALPPARADVAVAGRQKSRQSTYEARRLRGRGRWRDAAASGSTRACHELIHPSRRLTPGLSHPKLAPTDGVLGRVNATTELEMARL